MKFRVVHIITQLELGGAQQNTLYTVGHLDAGRFEPVLICGRGGILDEEAKAGTWPTYFVRWLVRPVNPFKDVLAAVAIYKLLRQLRPQIVHTHSSKAGILGRVAAYLAGVPVIIHTFHGFGFTPGQAEWVQNLFIKLERFCAHLSTHLIFVSKDNMEEAERVGIGVGKPHSLIRSGIRIEILPEPTKIRDELGIAPDAWMVISVGNFKPQKNPLDLVKTAQFTLEADPSIHFLFIGDGELRAETEKSASALGIASQVHFLGWRTDIAGLLTSSNCFLMTSLWEGLPRALVEACVAGIPPVAYAVNGVKDILIDGDTGFPIAPHNAASAAEKIVWLKNHPLDARLMGARARALVEKEFDIDRMVKDQENLYQSLYDAVPLKTYYAPLWFTSKQ